MREKEKGERWREMKQEREGCEKRREGIDGQRGKGRKGRIRES
jgi:hypothetical protein